MIARKRNELFQKALSPLAVVLLLLPFCLITPAHAQPASDQTATQRIMLVIDASGSMAQSDVEGGTRMDAAKSATIDVLKGLDNKVDAGLIAYGAHESNAEDNREKGCQDVEVLAGVGKPNLAQLESQINALQPTGYTPIGITLQKAADELGNSGKRSIILVSDGEDTCASASAPSSKRPGWRWY